MTMLKALWEGLYKETAKDTASVLRENILFRDLSDRELKFVANTVHIRNYRAGETIFRQGQTGFGMYIIESGSVNISVKADPQNENQEETVLTTLENGDFFGELALVEENGKRSASAIAGTDAMLIGFFKPNLFDIIQRRPSTGVKISLRLNEVLGKRLIETNRSLTLLDDKLKNINNGDVE